MKKALTLLFIVTIVNCGQKTTTGNQRPANVSIEGIWSYIENDSLYGEIILTKDHFWEYTEHGGEIYLPYIFKDDSIQFINWNGDPYATAKFTSVTKDEFTLVREKINVRYNRLTVPIDTASLLRGDENVLHDYVFKGLVMRKLDWEKSKEQ